MAAAAACDVTSLWEAGPLGALRDRSHHRDAAVRGANLFIKIEPGKTVSCVADERRMAMKDTWQGGRIRGMRIPAVWMAEVGMGAMGRVAGFFS